MSRGNGHRSGVNPAHQQWKDGGHASHPQLFLHYCFFQICSYVRYLRSIPVKQ